MWDRFPEASVTVSVSSTVGKKREQIPSSRNLSLALDLLVRVAEWL